MLDYNTEFTVNTVDMTLAETCNYLQISTINAINEFQTTVLLNEYGYLLENGCEIDYDTDGNDIITEGVMDLFTKIKEWIKATYEKLVSWISDRIDDVRQWFSRVGLKKEKASSAVKIYSECYRGFDKQFLPKFNGLWVNVKKLESAFPEFMKSVQGKMKSGDIAGVISSELNKLKDKHTESVSKETTIPVEYAAIAFENVYNTGNVVKSIRTSQAQAIKQIESILKNVSTSSQPKDVEKYKNHIRSISDASRELIKLYRDGIQSSITILKKVIGCISNADAVARAYKKAGNIRKAKIAGAIAISVAAIGLAVWKRKEIAAGAGKVKDKGKAYARLGRLKFHQMKADYAREMEMPSDFVGPRQKSGMGGKLAKVVKSASNVWKTAGGYIVKIKGKLQITINLDIS